MEAKQIPYGVSDFKRVRFEGRYYVDKTKHIPRLEDWGDFLFFVRPRRFGKSLFCDMVRCYYDVAEKENFGRLFGDLDIGKNPTGEANKYVVLTFDFSKVGFYEGDSWEAKFHNYLNDRLESQMAKYLDLFGNDEIYMRHFRERGAAGMLSAVYDAAHRTGLKLYVIVDEYDNFTNEIVTTLGKRPYQEITHGTGFYRSWFKLLKGQSDRIFMAGVSPVTMDDLTSGFNIATNITQIPGANAMVGFSHEEAAKLFADFRGCGKFKGDAEPHLQTVQEWYDGYCFSRRKAGVELVYNCDMALFYLKSLVDTGEAPESLVDKNIRSDWNKMRAILKVQRKAEAEGIVPITEELASKGEVTFPLEESFPIEDLCEEKNFKSLFFYYGIVTMNRVHRTRLYFRIPNECVRKQIFEYLRGEYAKHPNAVRLSEFLEKFERFAWDGEWEDLLRYLAGKYRDFGSPRDGIDGEARINGFLRAYLMMDSVYVAKPEFSHPAGYSDFTFFPDRSIAGGEAPGHSYVIELKYSKADASEADLAAKHAEAVAQLEKYAADPQVKKLAAGTQLHYITCEFKGQELARLEEVKSRPAVEMKSALRAGDESLREVMS